MGASSNFILAAAYVKQFLLSFQSQHRTNQESLANKLINQTSTSTFVVVVVVVVVISKSTTKKIERHRSCVVNAVNVVNVVNIVNADNNSNSTQVNVPEFFFGVKVFRKKCSFFVFRFVFFSRLAKRFSGPRPTTTMASKLRRTPLFGYDGNLGIPILPPASSSKNNDPASKDYGYKVIFDLL